jgi:hypothetical protein
MTNKQLYLLAGGILGASLIIYLIKNRKTNKLPPCPAGQIRKNGLECVDISQLREGVVRDIPDEFVTNTPNVTIATAETYKDYAKKLENL